jgi:hypothetical protein
MNSALARHMTWAAIVGRVTLLQPAPAPWYRCAKAAAFSLDDQELDVCQELRLAEWCREEGAGADQTYALALARGR